MGSKLTSKKQQLAPIVSIWRPLAIGESSNPQTIEGTHPTFRDMNHQIVVG